MCDGLSSFSKQKLVQQTEKRKEKKQKSVEKAIPNIADAIKTVVSLSRNEDFKIKCFNLIKAKDEGEFSDALKEKLWKIATCRLNVKPSAEDEDSQIVPEGAVDEANKTATDEILKVQTLTPENNEVTDGRGEDYFDDLAGEISFYDNQSTNDNCPTIDAELQKKTDALASDQESSFELLAKLHWDLSEEPQPRMHVQDSQTNHVKIPRACGKSYCASVIQGALYQGTTFVPRQNRDSISTLTKAVTDVTSPKAKLRCCESTLEPTEASTNSNDWLREFSQDCYWVADKNIDKQKETETSPLTLKETEKACTEQTRSGVRLSKAADDFDDLAELSVI